MRTIRLALTASIIGFTGTLAFARQSNSFDRLDLVALLPPTADLSGWVERIPRKQTSATPVGLHTVGKIIGFSRSAALFAERTADGLLMRVTLTVTTSGGAMDDEARGSIQTPTGDWPEGNPSGARVAPQSWQTIRPGRHTARGTYGLILRDGRAMVHVQLMRRFTPGSDGRPTAHEISHDDLLMAERLALGCLERLRKLGFGDERWKKTVSRKPVEKKPPQTSGSGR